MIQETLNFLTKEANSPYLILCIIAFITFSAFFLIKHFIETKSITFEINEKKTNRVIDLVKNDISKQHPFVVEKIFCSFYGKNIPYTIINFLLKSKNPNKKFDDYAKSSNYLIFSEVEKRFSLKNPKKIKLFNKLALIYFSTVVLFLLACLLITVNDFLLKKYSSSFLFGIFSSYMLFALLLLIFQSNAISAAERLAKNE